MAVNECYSDTSASKKSIFGLRLWNQMLYLLLFTYLLAGVSAADTEVSCANVRNIFEKKGILSAVDIQEQPNSDAGELCRTRGCCGAGARAKLTQQARTQLEGAIRSELAKLADILSNRAKRFDDFFRKLLKLSREGFHSMFKRTYGMIYEQHSYVFEQLFEQLERYYTRGDSDFDKMMDGFFGILYQKMFTVLNSQYNFDDKYLKCVNEHMRDIQPFEDVPHKLSVQLRRAFVATRTFHKALRSGSEVLRNMMQVEITDECATSWARLRFCGTCSGEQAPACSRYCHNVLRGCLATHADLRDQWDAYVDAVEKVADRLLGPFNIAMVVEPIDIKISEAIMSFQEHNQEISQKIFAGCGKPVLGGSGGSAGPFFSPDRARRFVRSIPDFDINPKPNDVDDFEIEASLESLVHDDPSLLSLHSPETFKHVVQEMKEQSKLRGKFLQYMKGNIELQEYEEHERRRREAEPGPAPGGEIDFRPYEFEGKRPGAGKNKKPAAKTEDNPSAEWGGPALERLVRETRARLRGSRQYWSQLPALLCAPVSVTAAPCYNGTARASYLLGAAGEGTAGLASNAEVRAGAGGAAAGGGGGGGAQQDVLRGLTARLKDAYNGVEVQWTDPSDDMPQSRTSLSLVDGSGSGLGSGDSDDGFPTDDEDRNTATDYAEAGSGARPDFDDTEPDSETERSPPPASEAPFIPSIISGPNTNNVQIRGRVDAPPAETDDLPTNSDDVETRDQVTPVREHPSSSAAEQKPSLYKALFTYALPVVCAWFGTIITDLV